LQKSKFQANLCPSPATNDMKAIITAEKNDPRKGFGDIKYIGKVFNENGDVFFIKTACSLSYLKCQLKNAMESYCKKPWDYVVQNNAFIGWVGEVK